MKAIILSALLGGSVLAQEAPTKPLWQLDLASASYGGGAIGDLANDGNLVLVFGTYFNDEHLYAVQAKDGKVLWKFKSEGGPFDASVALVDLDGDKKLEVLAADSSTGTLFCLNAAGKVVWKKKLPNSTDSPPAVADLDGDGKLEIVIGVMAMADRHGRVVVLDAATQKEKWTVKIPGHVQSEPALVDLDGDHQLDVLVTTWRGDKCVRALSGKDGHELWKHAMQGDMYHGVSVIESKEGVKLVAASIEGDLALLNAKGQPIWTKQPGGYLFAPTTLIDIEGDGALEIAVCSGRIHLFDLAGKELWKTASYGSVGRGAAAADVNRDGLPDLLFGASDRKFRAVEGKTGRELWAFDATTKGHVYEMLDSGPVIADFDGNGTLDAFFVAGKGTSDKTRAENYGRAYALSVGKGSGVWPMFRGNLRRTGVAKDKE
ncbi:MAG: PQQ-binding-like beta-propeller repeat protein [Pirellulaceae bacterium]